MPIRALHLAGQLTAEWQNADAARAIQLKKLKKLVNESYKNVAAYRCLMQRNRVKPEDIRSLGDIERLPIVSKDVMFEFSSTERINAELADKVDTVRIATSGSTGEPFAFDIDPGTDKWRKAQYLRPYVTNGRRPWTKVLRLTAGVNSQIARNVWLGPFPERRIDCTAPIADQLAQLQSLRPPIVQGYPSALRCLAFEIQAQGLSTPFVRRVFSDSELLTLDTRALISRAFGASVIDVYGTFETDNIGYQCSSGSDYHIAVDSVVFEVECDGAAVLDRDGSIVVTVLHSNLTPFIRYNLQDSGRHIAGNCRCGRRFPLMTITAGRCDDLVIHSDGRRESPMSMLQRLDPLSGFIREYQVVQEDINQFTVSVVSVRQLAEDDEQRIRSVITQDFPTAVVEIRTTPFIERTKAAKLKAFVCNIPAKTSA